MTTAAPGTHFIDFSKNSLCSLWSSFDLVEFRLLSLVMIMASQWRPWPLKWGCLSLNPVLTTEDYKTLSKTCNFSKFTLPIYEMVKMRTILRKQSVRIEWVDVYKSHPQCLTHRKQSLSFNCIIIGWDFCIVLVSRMWWAYWGSVVQQLSTQTLKPDFLGWNPDPTVYLLCDFDQVFCNFLCLSLLIYKVGIVIGMF